MRNLSFSLLVAFSLALMLSGQPVEASNGEHVYLDGQDGHFKLEEGKIYHWTWEGQETKAPEKPTVTGKTEAAKPAPPEEQPGALTSITREALEQMVDEFKNAVRKRDLDSIAAQFSPDAVIFITIDTPEGTQNLRFGKDEYMAHLQEGWSQVSHYDYEVKNLKMDISSDGQSATIESDIHESVGVQGMTVKTVTHENLALELINGNLQIIKVAGKVSL
jgi:ketosteroid isomerase-like protein